jgi:hypothetical protein
MDLPSRAGIYRGLVPRNKVGVKIELELVQGFVGRWEALVIVYLI